MDPRYKSPSGNVERDEESDFRDLGRHTRILQWMLRIGAAMLVVTAISSLMQITLLSRDYTQEEAVSNFQREALVAIAQLILFIAIAIVFGRWIVRAHRNLVPLGATYLEYRPGWAVGFFFIPILNLWKPYQAMKALWQNSHSVVKPDLQDITWLMPTWWTFWLISNFVGQMEFRTSMRQESVESYIVSSQVTVAGCVVDLVLYWVAAMLVGRIWEAQRKQRKSPEAFAPARGFADAN